MTQEELEETTPAEPTPEPTPNPEEPADPELGITLPDDAGAVEELSDGDRLLGFDADGNPVTATAEQVKTFATEGFVSTEAMEEALAGKMNAALVKTEGDCNDWTDPGRVYYVLFDYIAQQISNAPCPTAFGTIYIPSGHGVQLAFTYRDELYLRSNSWDNGWGAWRRLWHSGNFNPNQVLKADSRYTAAQLNEDQMAQIENQVAVISYNGIGGLLVSFSAQASPAPLQFLLDNYNDNTSLKWRHGVDASRFSNPNFRTIWDSGNLTPATAASVGLMSAADKIKLNAVASAMSLSADEPATMALDDEETVSAEVSIRAQRSAQYQMQTDELLYDALEAFARNHPEHYEFAEWIAAKDRIRHDLEKPETQEGGEE